TALAGVLAAEIRAGRRAGLVGHIKLRLEKRTAGLERHRVDVGNVVANHVEAGFIFIPAPKPPGKRARGSHENTFSASPARLRRAPLAEHLNPHAPMRS